VKWRRRAPLKYAQNVLASSQYLSAARRTRVGGARRSSVHSGRTSCGGSAENGAVATAATAAVSAADDKEQGAGGGTLPLLQSSSHPTRSPHKEPARSSWRFRPPVQTV
jgi:hypothetical protein